MWRLYENTFFCQNTCLYFFCESFSKSHSGEWNIAQLMRYNDSHAIVCLISSNVVRIFWRREVRSIAESSCLTEKICVSLAFRRSEAFLLRTGLDHFAGHSTFLHRKSSEWGFECLVVTDDILVYEICVCVCGRERERERNPTDPGEYRFSISLSFIYILRPKSNRKMFIHSFLGVISP